MSGSFALAQGYLKGSFTKATPEEYFHYLAKNCFRPGAYQDEKLSPIIKKIQEKVSGDIFNQQRSELELTPLQVAFIYENRAAQNYLSSHKNTELADVFGQTVTTYEELAASTLMIALNSKHRCDLDKLDTNLKQHILPEVLSLNSGSFSYKKNTNDFGKNIKTVYFSDKTKENHIYTLDSIIDQLRTTLQTLGIKTIQGAQNCFPRDWCVFTGGNKVGSLPINSTNDSPLALQRACYLEMYSGETNIKVSKYEGYVPNMGHSLGLAAKKGADLMQKCGDQFYSLPRFFCEGGNHLRLTNQKGEEHVFIGQTHWTHFHMQLRLEGYFKEKHPQSFDTKYTDDQIRDTLEEMYALGIFKINGKTGYLTKEQSHEVLKKNRSVPTETFKETAVNHRIIEPFNLSKDDIEKSKPIAEKYLWEKQQSFNVIAKMLSIAPDKLHFIPQMDNHLDEFILSGPKGSVFLLDHNASYAVLNKLSTPKNLIKCGLGINEAPLLLAYQNASQEIAKQVSGTYERIKNAFEKAHFKVIPTPGSFYMSKRIPFSGSIKFLNGLSGWSEKKQRYYYIIAGASIPNSCLGKVIMKTFELFLKSYVPNLDVYYVGHDPKDKEDFSEAMGLWNFGATGELGALGGVHCLTVEVESKDHTD